MSKWNKRELYPPVTGKSIGSLGFNEAIRQCDVCHFKQVLCYGLPPSDFVANYYKLSKEGKENWVCSECWVKAKAHDPEKDQFQVRVLR
jgi:hypothetical protein